MIDGLFGSGTERYDVEDDVRKLVEARAEAVAAGRRKTNEELRAAGGVVLSPLANVLLEHFSRSHVKASIIQSEENMGQAQTCSRRLVEYLAALEAVCILPYTADLEDMPRNWLGLSAATLEGVCDGTPQEMMAMPVIREGVESMRAAVERLRITEANILHVEQQHMPHLLADPVTLPILNGG